MSKLFPTNKEMGARYEKLATFLTFVTFVVWIVCFFINVVKVHMPTLFVYVFVCPVCYIIAMRCAYLTIQYTPASSGKVLLICSTIFLLLSVAAGFVPV